VFVGVALLAVGCRAPGPPSFPHPEPANEPTKAGSMQDPGRTPSATAAAPTDPHDSAWAGDVRLLLGGRQLDERTYRPVDEQFLHGAEASFRPRGEGLGLEVGATVGHDFDGALLFGDNSESNLADLYVGGRFTANTSGVVQPYFGVGASVLIVELNRITGNTNHRDDDVGFGAYAHGGIAVAVSKLVLLGIDVRSVFGSEVELFGVDTDADYTQVALFVGFRW